jgi:hypothetical protein
MSPDARGITGFYCNIEKTTTIQRIRWTLMMLLLFNTFLLLPPTTEHAWTAIILLELVQLF